MLHSTFFERLDRFAVFATGACVDEADLAQAPGYVSLEYLRHVPVGAVSRGQVDAYLVDAPHEVCCEISVACNLQCAVCIAATPRSSASSLSVNVFRDRLSRLPDEVSRVTITGGEPTLHPDLPAVMKCCAEFGKFVFLSTNGFDPSACMAALAVGGRALVAVSLHGTRAVHDRFVGVRGSFDRATDTIAAVVDSGRSVHVLTTATSDTVSDLAKLSLVVANMRVSEHRINLVKPNGRLGAARAPFEQVRAALKGLEVPHKVSVKRSDQPQLFLNCSGTMEARRGRVY